MRFIITVDDDDRERWPELPWAATIECSESGIETAESGIGTTPAEALTEMLRLVGQRTDDFHAAWTAP